VPGKSNRDTRILGALQVSSFQHHVVGVERFASLIVATNRYEGWLLCLGNAETVRLTIPIQKDFNCPPSSVGRAQGP
jgi:hypothetical protein